MATGGLTGVLLVGGASRRFGSPKALAELDGETLAARAWRTLGDACDERLAVGKRKDALPLPFDLIDDDTDVRAPIAGVVAGLRAARNDLCVFVPVDTPFLRPSDLRELAARMSRRRRTAERGRCRARTAGRPSPFSSAAWRTDS